MKRDTALDISGVSKHQYYYLPMPNKQGRHPSYVTLKIEGEDIIHVLNPEVIEQVKEIQKDPETNYGYH